MREIALTQGKVALVDDEDFERVNQFKWCAMNPYPDTWYAVRSITVGYKRYALQTMHRFILNVDSEHVDHLNHNGLDNRRGNLRPCTASENFHNRRAHKNNSSGYVGVSKARNKWRASLCMNYQVFDLGFYRTPEEAARAYDGKAKELFGEFARLNFPEG